MKALWEEGGRRILLSDNADGGAVMLRPVRFQCAGVWISAGIRCMYTCAWPAYSKFRLAPGLPERNYCVTRGVCVVWINIYSYFLNLCYIFTSYKFQRVFISVHILPFTTYENLSCFVSELFSDVFDILCSYSRQTTSPYECYLEITCMSPSILCTNCKFSRCFSERLLPFRRLEVIQAVSNSWV